MTNLKKKAVKCNLCYSIVVPLLYHDISYSTTSPALSVNKQTQNKTISRRKSDLADILLLEFILVAVTTIPAQV